MTKVVITEAAWNDLASILRHVGSNEPVAAERLIDRLYAQCRSIAAFTGSYPLVPGYEHRLVRRRVAGNYLIFYRWQDDLVEIFHVLHGARDHTDLL